MHLCIVPKDFSYICHTHQILSNIFVYLLINANLVHNKRPVYIGNFYSKPDNDQVKIKAPRFR